VNERELPGGAPPGVVCHGYLRKDDPAHYRQYMELLASARLFVFPMRPGPIPGVLREAFWMCTPVILTNVPHASDRVQDGRNGVLAEPRNPRALAEGLGRLLGDAALRQRLGVAARSDVVERFDATASFQQVEALFRRVLKRNLPN